MDRSEIERLAERMFRDARTDLQLDESLADETTLAPALLVHDLCGKPSYWLVPVTSADRLLGFVRIGLDGELKAYGRFGQARQLSGFPPLEYLSACAANRELRKRFGDGHTELGSARLVHDGAESRIAWMCRSRSRDGSTMLLFWTFGTFYSRPAGLQRPVGLI